MVKIEMSEEEYEDLTMDLFGAAGALRERGLAQHADKLENTAKQLQNAMD